LPVLPSSFSLLFSIFLIDGLFLSQAGVKALFFKFARSESLRMNILFFPSRLFSFVEIRFLFPFFFRDGWM